VLERHVLRAARARGPSGSATASWTRRRRAPARRLDRLARGGAEDLHLVQRGGRVEVRVVVGRQGHHRDVPVRVEQVQRRDRRVVDPHALRLQLARDQAVVVGLVGDRLGQLDVRAEVVAVAQEVGEDRLHRDAARVGHAVDVVADHRDPVRRVEDDDVGRQRLHAAPDVVVGPAQPLPAALPSAARSAAGSRRTAGAAGAARGSPPRCPRGARRGPGAGDATAPVGTAPGPVRSRQVRSPTGAWNTLGMRRHYVRPSGCRGPCPTMPDAGARGTRRHHVAPRAGPRVRPARSRPARGGRRRTACPSPSPS
jgi:hypothetical protein